MSSSDQAKVIKGEGFAVGSLDELGEGYGFRKVRRELGVNAFGVNAIVLPVGWETGGHYHEEQEELYFVHRGTIEMSFGDGEESESVEIGEGGFARVDAKTVRSVRNAGESDAVYVVVGGKDGYVGRDGKILEGEDPSQRSFPTPGGPADTA